MSDIKTNEALDILDKIQFFGGQRAGRELWSDKQTEVQDKDLENFNRDIEKVRKYIESKSNAMERIIERLEEEKHKEMLGGWETMRIDRAIEIVKEEGGLDE